MCGGNAGYFMRPLGGLTDASAHCLCPIEECVVHIPPQERAPSLESRGARSIRNVFLGPPDLPHHRVHISEVPDLGELAAFEAIKSELRNSHPTTGRLNSLEGSPVGTGDREVQRDIVAVDNEVPCLPMPVRKCVDQRRELRRNGGWIQ